MPLKLTTTKQRSSFFLACVSYRLPLPVRKILIFESGSSNPICPRCDDLLDREYMAFCDCCGQKLAWNFFEFASEIHAPRKSNAKQSRTRV